MERVTLINAHIFRKRKPLHVHVLIKYGSDGRRADIVPFGNIGECLRRIFQIFKNAGNSEDRYFLSLENKRIVFKVCPAAAETFIPVGMVSDLTGSADSV